MSIELREKGFQEDEKNILLHYVRPQRLPGSISCGPTRSKSGICLCRKSLQDGQILVHSEVSDETAFPSVGVLVVVGRVDVWDVLGMAVWAEIEPQRAAEPYIGQFSDSIWCPGSLQENYGQTKQLPSNYHFGKGTQWAEKCLERPF